MAEPIFPPGVAHRSRKTLLAKFVHGVPVLDEASELAPHDNNGLLLRTRARVHRGAVRNARLSAAPPPSDPPVHYVVIRQDGRLTAFPVDKWYEFKPDAARRAAAPSDVAAPGVMLPKSMRDDKSTRRRRAVEVAVAVDAAGLNGDGEDWDHDPAADDEEEAAAGVPREDHDDNTRIRKRLGIEADDDDNADDDAKKMLRKLANPGEDADF